MKILVINGPNINMLGIREPEIYGNKSYKELCNLILNYSKEKGIETEIFQSNHEGALVDKIQEAYMKFDGIVINPAAYTHTSIALADALKSVGIKTVEVHISAPSKREEYRKISYIKECAVSTVEGLGFLGYLKAIDILTECENDSNI